MSLHFTFSRSDDYGKPNAKNLGTNFSCMHQSRLKYYRILYDPTLLEILNDHIRYVKVLLLFSMYQDMLFDIYSCISKIRHLANFYIFLYIIEIYQTQQAHDTTIFRSF